MTISSYFWTNNQLDIVAGDTEVCCICFDQLCSIEVRDCGHQMCAHCVLALCCHNKPDPKTTVAAVPLCPFCRSSIAQLSSIEVKGGDSEQDAYSKTTMKARRSRNMNEGSSSFKGLSSGVGSLGRIGGCGAGWERLQLKINGLISPQALILSSEF
nr:putative E3 ubiquitin-protein ligase XBAT31 [Ipomoea trifida]